MSDQNQRAEGGTVAIQSGRDTTINQGITPKDMRQIIETLAAQMPAYAAIAAQIVDSRLKDFEDRIMDSFADGSNAQLCKKRPY
jgi:hypothetical protein